MLFIKIVIAAFVLLFPVWDLFWHLLGIRHIYPWELKKVSSKDLPFVIDVRLTSEFRLFHLEKSVNRPDLITNKKSLPFSEDQPVLVVSQTGHRSIITTRKLKKMGYKNVFNLALGLVGWKMFGGKTVSGSGINE